MAERKGQVMQPNKIAMSKALGAAFLNHQVEQLEKTVGHNPTTGNWRDRRMTQGPPNSSPKRANNAATVKYNDAPRKKVGDSQNTTASRGQTRPRGGGDATGDSPGGRRSLQNKDADIVVVDASVLIHGIDYIKKWVKNGREEIVVVPLEVLNTLDLLKKGTSQVAQKARAASRILESQVGTNSRIRVQRDEAFVLWDKIPFKGLEDSVTASPEWVRRTICCARWESERAKPTGAPAKTMQAPNVVLAICNVNATQSPSSQTVKLDDTAGAPLTPVPLPAPTQNRDNKFEPRSSGSLVSQWASRAGVRVFEVPATASPGHRSSSEDERPKRPFKPRTPEGKGLVERSPAVLAMMEMVSQPRTVVRVLARGEKLDP